MTKAGQSARLLSCAQMRSINVDRRPLLDVAIQPLEVIIAQADAAVCGFEPSADSSVQQVAVAQVQRIRAQLAFHTSVDCAVGRDVQR